MGMSLERVQFKFASIIGELCSQPDVLSQFAVWLDLRLAEYKLKGAISLDCSGEEPDPVWLKGLSKHKSVSKVSCETDRQTQSHSPADAYGSPSLQRLTQSSSDSGIPVSQSHALPSAELAERLSPDIVVVKEEPDVYPISLRAHENRKRSATDSVFIDYKDIAKQARRMSTTESPSHQSLMSVIGGFDNDAEDVDNKGNNSDFPSTSTSDTVTIAEFSADASGDDLSSFKKTPVGWADHSDLGQDTTNTSDTSRVKVHTERWKASYVRAKEQAEGLRDERMNRIPNRENMSKSRVANITSTVALFERWLWDSHEREKRGIHDIPPEELDVYLAEFFSTIKQPNGNNYSAGSLSSLRGYLEFYLRCTNYPASITNTGSSRLFRQSQAAFKRKIREIRQEMAM